MATLVFGAGYLGAALADTLCAAGSEVLAMDSGFATDWPALERLQARHHGRFRLIRGDVRSTEAVEAAFAMAAPIESVFLLAAQASAHPDAAPPEYTEETNLRGPRLVLDAAAAHGRSPVVFGSSFHVYGSDLSGDIDESHPYGAFRDLSHLSKVYVEKLGELYARERGVPFAPVRLGVVYGVGPVMKHDLRFVTAPHAFCIHALAGRPLVVSASGARPFAYTHLADAVSALRAAPAAGYAPANAAGEVITALDVAEAVCTVAIARELPAPTVVSDAPPASGAPFRVATRLADRGWHPARRLAESVGEVFDHYTLASKHGP